MRPFFESSSGRRFAGLALMFAAMAALRAAYLMLPLPAGDGGAYLSAARRLLGGGYLFQAGPAAFGLLYRTPGYPVFLAAVMRFAGESLGAVALSQHFLGLLSAFAAYRIGLRVWGRTAAVCAALFTGFHFHFIYAESYPLSEALSVLLLLASLYMVLALDSDEKAGPASFAFGGLLLAAGGLCRPEITGLAPICAGYFLFKRGAPAAAKVKRAVVYLLPVFILLGAWTLRNGLLFEYWGLTPNSQVAFFDGPAGMCAKDKTSPFDMPGAQAFAHQYDYGRVNRGVGVLEEAGIPYQWSARRIGAIARTAVKRSPGQYLRLSLLQLRGELFTGPTWPPRDLTESMPDILTAGTGGAAGALLRGIGRIDGFLEGLFLVPLFLIGCLAAVFFRSKAGGFLAASAVFLLSVYAFLSPLVLRYRLVAEPLMGLLASGAVAMCLSRLPGLRVDTAADASPVFPRRFSGALFGTALLASLCVLCLFLAGLLRAYRARSLASSPEATLLLRSAGGTTPDKEAVLRLGYMELERADYPAALGYFDTALRLAPESKAAGDGRADALYKMGRGKEAMAELCLELASHGPSPDLYYNIAQIEYLSGDTVAAARDFLTVSGFRDTPPALRAVARSRAAGFPARGYPGPCAERP